jgi:hypothetical protein
MLSFPFEGLPNGFHFGLNEIEDRVRIPARKKEFDHNGSRCFQLIGMRVAAKPQRFGANIGNQTGNSLINLLIGRIERDQLTAVIDHVQVFPNGDLRHVEGLGDLGTRQCIRDGLGQRPAILRGRQEGLDADGFVDINTGLALKSGRSTGVFYGGKYIFPTRCQNNHVSKMGRFLSGSSANTKGASCGFSLVQIPAGQHHLVFGGPLTSQGFRHSAGTNKSDVHNHLLLFDGLNMVRRLS